MTLLDTIDYFSSCSGFNSNISKCEIAVICALTWAHVTVYGLKSFDLISNTLEILGLHFLYNKKIQNEKSNFRYSKYS